MNYSKSKFELKQEIENLKINSKKNKKNAMVFLCLTVFTYLLLTQINFFGFLYVIGVFIGYSLYNFSEMLEKNQSIEELKNKLKTSF